MSADLSVRCNCASLFGVCVCMNNFSDESLRPRDMLFVLKDTLFIKDENYSKHVDLFIGLLPRAIKGRYPCPKCEKFNTLSQFSY